VRSSNVSRTGNRCWWAGLLTEIGTATWLMLWPEDGRMMKEDIRRIYDGSLFYELAARREKKSQ
jgi:peroxygenase